MTLPPHVWGQRGREEGIYVQECPGIVGMPVIPALERLKFEDREFKVSRAQH